MGNPLLSRLHECPHCETPYDPTKGDTCLNCGGSVSTPGLPADDDPEFDRRNVAPGTLEGMPVQHTKIMSDKTAVGLTDQGQPDAVCPKCQQPIAEGQMVNYPQGRETHVQCPPAGAQQPSSRLNLPPGFKPRQPQQAPQPTHKPGMIPPSVGRPQASAKKADSRFIDDEWRELLTAQGWHFEYDEDDDQVWGHQDTDTEVVISTNEAHEPQWAFYVNDVFVEEGHDTTALLGLITGDSIEVEPKQQKPEPRNFAEGEVPEMDVADKHQLKSWGVVGRQRTVRGKMAGRPPRFSFAVPAEAAGKVAFHLAKAGMRDFEVVNYEADQASVFAFTNEPELHVAEEIVRAEFNSQIAKGNDMWATWAPQQADPSMVNPTHGQQRMTSGKLAYEDPNEYLRGKEFSGPQAVPSRYERALDMALAGLDVLAEIGPSQDIKGCAQMSAADLRQFANDQAQGKARTFASGDKVAGQWGEKSYDGDQVHDVLDRHREGGNGFDNPIPPENLKALLGELDGHGLDDDVYLGVIVFLVTHGSKVPRQYRQSAAQIVQELRGDEEYLSTWSNPKLREAELEREFDILKGGKTAAGGTFEEWLAEVKAALDGINMPMAEWQAAYPFDYQAEFQAGTTPIEAAKKANQHYWSNQPLPGKRPFDKNDMRTVRDKPDSMTDAEVQKMFKYRRKKYVAWLDEMGFLDAEGNGEMLAEYDAGDFWKKDELYEEGREMIREERRMQSGYRRSMRGPRPYNRKEQPASGQ